MASSIVRSTVRRLGNLLLEETKALYEVRDKIEKLQEELEWMECFLRDADTQQHKEKVLRRWVSQVQDLAYDAEDIMERYVHGVTYHPQNGIRNTLKWLSCIVYTCDAFTLRNLGSEIEDLTTRILDLTSRFQRYGIPIIEETKSLEYNLMRREEMMTYPHIQEDVVGLEEDIRQVLDQVLNTKVTFVGIRGIGGSGKTTLARRVYLNKHIQDGYTCVWVYLSQEFESTRIFTEILHGLSMGMNENVDAGALPQKVNELLRKQKCFVVLDDIWNIKDWRRLQPAFESIGSESKIVLTTRTQDLLNYVDPTHGYIHHMKPLTLEEGWKLLQRKAFFVHKDEDDYDTLAREKMGREMLKHCGGLPLAILALGGILCNKKTISERKDVREDVASYLMSRDYGHESDNISEVLDLSFQDLPFYLKPCFLYLGSFPEDHEISCQKLYHLWQAEGLTVVEESETSSYDVGEKYLKELLRRSLVQVVKYWKRNGRIKTCKLHDIMRDLCLKKGKEIDFLKEVESTKLNLESVLAGCTENKKPRRLAVHWAPVDALETVGLADPPKSKHGEEKATCVRSLLVFVTYNVVLLYGVSAKVWKSLSLLRVLDLSRAPITGPLEGVEDLIHLRYLSLNGTLIKEVSPRLFDLQSVETLDLRYVNFFVKKRWPCKLGKLSRLRHLYLPDCFRVIMEEAGKKLSLPFGQLETLVNFDPERCEIKDLLNMTKLKYFMLNSKYVFTDKDELKVLLEAPVIKNLGQVLNRIRLSINAMIIEEETTILSSLGDHPSSSFELVIHPVAYRMFTAIPGGVVFADSLTRLETNYCNMGDAHLFALGMLPCLKHLKLCAFILDGPKLTFSADSFLQLKSIRLFEARNLQELEVEDGALPKLQLLQFYKCKELKKLPQGLPQSVHIGCWEPRLRKTETTPAPA